MARSESGGAEPSIHRPTRGATRVDALSVDAGPLQDDLERLARAPEWRQLKDGESWAQLVLIKDDFRLPLLASCPGIVRVLDALPSRVRDACLKRLGPGGSVHPHRDLVGAAPLGVVRLHIPVVTHRDVEFCVSGHRLFLAPGEAWLLDTSYRHSVANRSEVERIHLVVDLDLDDALRRLLPSIDVRDRLHVLYFWLFCAGRAVAHLSDPRHFRRLVRGFLQLRFKGTSTLPEP